MPCVPGRSNHVLLRPNCKPCMMQCECIECKFGYPCCKPNVSYSCIPPCSKDTRINVSKPDISRQICGDIKKFNENVAAGLGFSIIVEMVINQPSERYPSKYCAVTFTVNNVTKNMSVTVTLEDGFVVGETTFQDLNDFVVGTDLDDVVEFYVNGALCDTVNVVELTPS